MWVEEKEIQKDRGIIMNNIGCNVASALARLQKIILIGGFLGVLGVGRAEALDCMEGWCPDPNNPYGRCIQCPGGGKGGGKGGGNGRNGGGGSLPEDSSSLTGANGEGVTVGKNQGQKSGSDESSQSKASDTKVMYENRSGVYSYDTSGSTTRRKNAVSIDAGDGSSDENPQGDGCYSPWCEDDAYCQKIGGPDTICCKNRKPARCLYKGACE